jgi:hypothetical protein
MGLKDNVLSRVADGATDQGRRGFSNAPLRNIHRSFFFPLAVNALDLNRLNASEL